MNEKTLEQATMLARRRQALTELLEEWEKDDLSRADLYGFSNSNWNRRERAAVEVSISDQAWRHIRATVKADLQQQIDAVRREFEAL